MKKAVIQLSILLISFILVSSCVIAESSQEINVTIDGKKIVFDQPPIIINDRTMVPLRAIFEELGAEVQWDGDAQTIIGTKSIITTHFTVGKDTYHVNGILFFLDSPPTVVNSRTLVPARAIAESFGCNVEWNDSTKTVSISTNNYKEYVGTRSKPFGEYPVKYYGEYKDGDFYGFAVCEPSDGTYCMEIGKFKKGTKTSGHSYSGQLKNGLPNGKGTWYHDSSINDYGDKFNYYDGKWKNGLPNGYGTASFGGTKSVSWKGYAYYGEWVAGKKQGQGKAIYDDLFIYNGEWKYDKMNGQGILTYGSDKIYSGEWKDGKPVSELIFTINGNDYVIQLNGGGTCTYSNGNKYEGQFKNFKENGQGTYYFSNGDKYEGEFKDGKCNGQGIMYYADGARYEGEWKDGEMIQGTIYFDSDKAYSGECKDGVPNGKGISYNTNGDRYEGEFKNGSPIGQGTYYWADGTTTSGQWVNDEFID